MRLLYGYAVIEVLTEPQSWQAMADKNFVPLLKASRTQALLYTGFKNFHRNEKKVLFDMLYEKY